MTFTKSSLPVLCLALVSIPETLAQTHAPTGPAAEKRFPPLKLPKGFKATLYACDPAIEYPSAICLGPKAGSLFVAVDYMTGLGTDIVKRDEIRLLEDTDGDGYADKITVVAKDFNSIMGLAYHDGTLYVMHAPFLTSLKITKDGAAERRDLLSGVGLTPEKNPVRLHCANGVVMGYDGWLYLALGDNGCDIPRKGQNNLVLNGGGILRCRADGSHVHVFATGLRNIYDVALDEDLNVFTRDNENDGGTYMIRWCHSFFGADHGYPYLYYERPDEALPPIADLGLGSSAGGVCYNETAFPPEYRGNLFFCEWGKSVVRCKLDRSGSGFAKTQEIEFATSGDRDPYPFKPTDIVVDHDGAMYVSDWADGQRPKRGRARIYRITAEEKVKPARAEAKTLPELILELDSESHLSRVTAQTALGKSGAEAAKAVRAALAKGSLGVRARMHAVWLLSKELATVQELLDMASKEREPRAQVQALRAIADRTDVALGGSRRTAQNLAAELSEFGKGKDPRVVLEIILTLGRLEWPEAPRRLGELLTKSDLTLEHAAMQTLRRANNWQEVLKLLDLPNKNVLRSIALRAIADRPEPVMVDGLIERLQKVTDSARRLAYADALTRVHRQPGPWKYWGYRPGPRPANTVAWERTKDIEEALDRVLANPDGKVRLAVLKRMQREQIPIRQETLTRTLTAVVGDTKQSTENRLIALNSWIDLPANKRGSVEDLALTLEDGPVLAEVIKRLSLKSTVPSADVLVKKLASTSPELRASALKVLAARRVREVAELVPKLLGDADARVRRAAAEAAGDLGVRPAIDGLLLAVKDADPGVREASLDALRQLKEARVVPLALAALTDARTERAALECIVKLGGPEHAKTIADVARRNLAYEIQTIVIRGMSQWTVGQDVPASKKVELRQAIAAVQGNSGMPLYWHVRGPLSEKDAAQVTLQYALTPKDPLLLKVDGGWHARFAHGSEARWALGKASPGMWVGATDIFAADPALVQFMSGSAAPYRVWLDDKLVFERKQAGAFQVDADRFTVKVSKGLHRLLVETTAKKEAVDFHLHFRRLSSKAEHEKLTEAALAKKGSVERGSRVFSNIEKSNCLKCHRLGDKGERIGPDLTGVGSRFSRIYLIESILEPSRNIAPSFETVVVELNDGKLVTGLPIAETEKTLTLADNQGQKHVLAKSAIAERRRHPQSTMPEGLEQRLTADEFVDLIAFLVSQKAGVQK